VIEDPPCGMLILDEGDQTHRAGADRASSSSMSGGPAIRWV
jgi:hypothetical protein